MREKFSQVPFFQKNANQIIFILKAKKVRLLVFKYIGMKLFHVKHSVF